MRCSRLPQRQLMRKAAMATASRRYSRRSKTAWGRFSEKMSSRSLEKAASYCRRFTTISRGMSARPSPSKSSRADLSQLRLPPEKAAVKKAPSLEKGMRRSALKSSAANISPSRSSAELPPAQ